MQLHDYSPNPGAKRRVKRLGCGESSGHGKTSCKGNKGQKARSGSGTRVGFEGGQMPLHRRLPKRGFNNYDFRDKIGVSTSAISTTSSKPVPPSMKAALRKVGLINGPFDGIKALGNGEVTKAHHLVVPKSALPPARKSKKPVARSSAPNRLIVQPEGTEFR
jgi:large subunit ribosomal protein L15